MFPHHHRSHPSRCSASISFRLSCFTSSPAIINGVRGARITCSNSHPPVWAHSQIVSPFSFTAGAPSGRVHAFPSVRTSASPVKSTSSSYMASNHHIDISSLLLRLLPGSRFYFVAAIVLLVRAHLSLSVQATTSSVLRSRTDRKRYWTILCRFPLRRLCSLPDKSLSSFVTVVTSLARDHPSPSVRAAAFLNGDYRTRDHRMLISARLPLLISRQAFLLPSSQRSLLSS